MLYSKEQLLHVFELLEAEGKKKITVEDVEKYISDDIENAHLVALEWLRILVDAHYIAANDNNGHAVLAKENRRNWKEQVRCFDRLVMLVLEQDGKTAEEIAEELEFDAPFSACMINKCDWLTFGQQRGDIPDIDRALRGSLQRLFFADMVEEQPEGRFRLKAEICRDKEVYEPIIDRCYSCSKFRHHIQENHTIN